MAKRSKQDSGWRTSHSKIEANDEPSRKGSLNSVIFRVRKTGKEKLWKSEPVECESWEKWSNGATRCRLWRVLTRLQQFIIGNDETESELSMRSRSFSNRVDDQVQKNKNDRSSMNVREHDEKRFMIWRMFMSVTLETAVFMGKNYLNTCQYIVNTTDFILKQLFDISARWVFEQDEISGLETIRWENHSWKCLWLVTKGLSIFRALNSTSFSDSVLCLGKICENPQSNGAWEDRLGWFKSSS